MNMNFHFSSINPRSKITGSYHNYVVNFGRTKLISRMSVLLCIPNGNVQVLAAPLPH